MASGLTLAGLRLRGTVDPDALAWRNAHSRHPDVLAAQRRERARVRSEKGPRWGGHARADLALAA